MREKEPLIKNIFVICHFIVVQSSSYTSPLIELNTVQTEIKEHLILKNLQANYKMEELRTDQSETHK